MIEVSEEFLATVLGTSPGEITEALKDGEDFKPQAEIESFIKTRFDEAVYRAKKSGHKEGLGRGQKESLTIKERELKEKFGVEGATIDEVIDNVIDSVKKSATTNPDDVRNSEVYINETKRLKAIIQEKEAEIDKEKSNFTKSETIREAKALGIQLLKKANFVLPEDEEIRDNLLEVMFNSLENDSTRLSLQDKKIIVLDANGRPKENENGTKDITFEEHLMSSAKRYFKQAVADDRKSPANKNAADDKGDPNDPPMNLPEIKSHADFYREMNKITDPKEGIALKTHYTKLVEDGVIKE